MSWWERGFVLLMYFVLALVCVLGGVAIGGGLEIGEIRAEAQANKARQVKRAAEPIPVEVLKRIEQVWWDGELRVLRDAVTGCEYLMARTSSHVYSGNDVDVSVTLLEGTCALPPPKEVAKP